MTDTDTIAAPPHEPPAPAVKAKRAPPKRLPGESAPAAAQPADHGHYEPALRVDLIDPSPHNRKTMAKLEELAASIAEHGVISAILVRPTADGRFELVHGERRWRAVQLAGLQVIPATVRELSDVQALEIQLIENVQREDVHPLEEADGYKLLIDRHGYTVDKVVEKTGKSRAWVYGRLKLCSLAKVPRQALLEGKFTPSIALMIARIPTQSLQEQATAGVLGKSDWQEYDSVGVERGSTTTDGRRRAEPLNARQAALYIQSKFMLRLELARFDIADKTLVPKAGSCTDCVHRTGNQAELFSDVSTADVCTNPPCHEAKTKAAFERAAAAAKAEGVAVVKGKEAESMFDARGELTWSARSQYFDPAAEVPYELAPAAKKLPTWSKLLGGELAHVAKKVVQDHAGAARTVYVRKEAEKLLAAAGKVPKPAERTAEARGSDPYAAQQRKRIEAAKHRGKVVQLALRQLAGKASAAYLDGNGKEATAWWRWFSVQVLKLLGCDEQVVLARSLGLDFKTTNASRGGPAEAALKKEIETAGVVACRGLVVAMVASTNAAGGSYSSDYSSQFRDACKEFNVDLRKISSEAQAAKVKAAKTAKSDKAAPSTKPSKKSAQKSVRK